MIEGPRTRVLVAGCAYGGIAVVVNLLDLCLGKPARGAPNKVPHELALKGVPVDIHIVDERDGYREYRLNVDKSEEADQGLSTPDRLSVGFRIQ